MDNKQEFLFEGQVERLNTCKVIKDNPLLVVENHFEDRLKVDRNYIDFLKIDGLSTDLIYDKVIDLVTDSTSSMKSKWVTRCKSQLSTIALPLKKTQMKPLPFFKGYKYVLYYAIPLDVIDKKQKEPLHYVINVAVEVLCDTLYTVKYKKECNNAWKNNGLLGVNNLMQEKAPGEFTQLIKDKKMSFNNPYFFIGTVIPILTRMDAVSNKDFRSADIDEHHPIVYGDKVTISFNTWNKMFKRALELPDMKGNVRINKKSNNIVQEFYNQGYFDDKL